MAEWDTLQGLVAPRSEQMQRRHVDVASNHDFVLTPNTRHTLPKKRF